MPLGYLKAHKNVVWFTGNSYPGPITPYEDELTSFLNDGGRLFMSYLTTKESLASKVNSAAITTLGLGGLP